MLLNFTLLPLFPLQDLHTGQHPSPASFTLKMMIAMHTEMLEQLQQMM
jgi:hypothetical protein